MQSRSRFPRSENPVVPCSSVRVSRSLHLCGVESIAPSSLSAHSQSFLCPAKPIVLPSTDNLILLLSLVMSFLLHLRLYLPILPLSIVPSSFLQSGLPSFLVSLVDLFFFLFSFCHSPVQLLFVILESGCLQHQIDLPPHQSVHCLPSVPLALLMESELVILRGHMPGI